MNQIMFTPSGRIITNGSTDAYGNPVERTKQKYPYSYSPYVQWQHDDPKMIEQANGSAYSDRLYQWDSGKYNSSSQEVFGNEHQSWNNRSPKMIEQFLRVYWDDPSLILVKVIEHCNVSSGYPVWCFVVYTERNK
jgi:hypothetical protein